MTKRAMVLVLLAPMVGCTMTPQKPTVISLQNPQTKEVKDCKPSDWNIANIYGEAEACAKSYEKLGYVRVTAVSEK